METPPVSARSPRALRSPAGDSDADAQTGTEDTQDETLEPLLQDNEDRFCFLPIHHPDMYEFYKKAQASYWTVEEVDLSQDDRDWKNLTNGERHFIKHVLAFFAASDGIVLENLAVRFMQEIQIPEARAFYAFQAAVETVHAEMYGRLLECYVSDAAERRDLFRAMHTLPTVAKKAVWALRWIGEGLGVGLVEDALRAAAEPSTKPNMRPAPPVSRPASASSSVPPPPSSASPASFAQRLLAFACVEGIHFSGAFCAVYWLKKRGLMPGLTFSNELISRDEGLHTDFACLLYRGLRRPLCPSQAYAIVEEAVALEREFTASALPVDLIGMNAAAMGEYVEFVADRLLVSLGYAPLYRAKNPFDWMELISLQGKTNFFERRVGEYQRAGVMSSVGVDRLAHVFTLDADF